jgi:hypothetical protein
MTPESSSRPESPLAGASSQRTPWIVAGLGLLVVLAGVGLLSRGAGAEASGGEAAQAPTSASQKQGSSHSGGGGGAASGKNAEGAEAEAAPRRFDSAICWKELNRFNEAVTIDTFREWAMPLLASRDPAVRDYLKERLTELIGNDTGRAGQVLDWARDAKGAEFKVILSALRDSEAAQQPQVAARMMDAGLDATLEPERRAGVLSALDTQKRFDPASLDRLANFAKDPASGEAGWAATRTIARVMKQDFSQKGDVAPYMNRLLTIGAESPDEQIRYLAQMMPMHAAPVLDAEATERYTKILATEGNESGRDAAAHNLSLSTDKAKVLELFSRTFETDTAVCVRWALFRFSARVAGREALPMMAHMAAIDPRFQPAYQEFESLYASGTLDFVRVWNSLPNQDPYNCLEHHD